MEINYTLSISEIVSLILGIGTLILAILVYRKLLPSELKVKQLSVVLELIDHLNKYVFNISKAYYNGAYYSGNITSVKRNLFEYLRENTEDSVFEDNLRIMQLNPKSQPYNLAKFIENPLTPKDLIKYLSPFISTAIRPFQESDLNENDNILVFIDTPDDMDKYEFYQEDLHLGFAHAFTNHSEFLRAISKLKFGIEKWCKSKGIKNLNFRDVNSQQLF